MLISNPMLSGYPYEIGFAAAVAGDGNTDALQAWAETEATIWDAKGIHQMYGPQIDLVTDPAGPATTPRTERIRSSWLTSPPPW